MEGRTGHAGRHLEGTSPRSRARELQLIANARTDERTEKQRKPPRGGERREVITQYDLNAGLQAEAMALVNERAGLAPFNPNISYMVAHTVCARLENPHA
jgi:hypothetical protein